MSPRPPRRAGARWSGRGKRRRVRPGPADEGASMLHDLIFDYTLRNVALGSAILGVVSGILGCFAVLRRQALLGDTLSHAALPGICLAFMATGSKDLPVLLLGAGLAGWLGTWSILRIVQDTRVED